MEWPEQANSETESRLVAAKDWEEWGDLAGGVGMAKGHRVSFWNDENVQEFIVVMAVQLCECTKSH